MILVKKIAGFTIAVLAGLYALGFVLPDVVHVERALVIDAPAEKIFPLVGDLRQWQRWSPWAALDENMKTEITGDALGQTMVWSSDHPEVGNGSQEIITYDAPRLMASRLVFDGQGGGVGTIEITPWEGKSRVVWSFDTHMRDDTPVFARPLATYFGFFMDRLLGPMFENGLKALKDVAQS